MSESTSTGPQATTETDREHLRAALALAARGLGKVSPNPLVGAVVVSGGRVVGEGWHEGPGTPHAEVAALRAAGGLAEGGTLYVSLEPCVHHGRTPPCATAIRDARVVRVVAAMRDPNPMVDGRGFAFLRSAGITVVEGLMGREAERLNASFIKHVRTGLPLATLKMAASLDGKVADRVGRSRWITGEAAREDVHRMRAASDAIIVGARTALLDDPSLTVRLPDHSGRQPARVVVDGRGGLPPRGPLFDGSARTIIATTEGAPVPVRRRWEEAGADVLVFTASDRAPRVPLEPLFETLGKRDVQSLLIEGGPTLAWEAVRCGLVDRVVLYLAPKLIGGEAAAGVLAGESVATLADAIPLTIRSIEMLGGDLKVAADVRRDAARPGVPRNSG